MNFVCVLPSDLPNAFLVFLKIKLESGVCIVYKRFLYKKHSEKKMNNGEMYCKNCMSYNADFLNQELIGNRVLNPTCYVVVE